MVVLGHVYIHFCVCVCVSVCVGGCGSVSIQQRSLKLKVLVLTNRKLSVIKKWTKNHLQIQEKDMMQIAQQSRQKSNSRQSKAVRRREAMKKIVKETKSDNLVEKGKKDKKLTVITKMEGSSNLLFI